MKKIFLSLLFILCLFLTSEYVFAPAHLFYEIVWLDIPMHIFGGMGFAFLFASILKFQNKKITFAKIVISVMIIGILWEIYEYTNHIYFGKDWNGILDTIKDLFDDFLGASLVCYFNKKN